MKPIRTTLLLALLAASSLHAESPDQAELLSRVRALAGNPIASPRDVADLTQTLQALDFIKWQHAQSLTYEQQLQNSLLAEATDLIRRKVSLATAIDFAANREIWNLAADYSHRAGKETDALNFAQRWLDADPTSYGRRVEWWVIRAKCGEDVRQEIDASLVGKTDLTHEHSWRLVLAWNQSAIHAGETSSDVARAEFLGKLLTSAAPEHSIAIRITAINTKFQSGANVNAEIVAFLGTLQGKLPPNKAVILFNAFSPALATKDEAISFYDTLLRSVEADANSAPLLRRILDQKTKLQ